MNFVTNNTPGAGTSLDLLQPMQISLLKNMKQVFGEITLFDDIIRLTTKITKTHTRTIMCQVGSKYWKWQKQLIIIMQQF